MSTCFRSVLTLLALQEAASIIPESVSHFDDDMGTPYEGGLEARGQTDPTNVADAIVSYANRDVDDTTGTHNGRLGIYETAEMDPTLDRPDLLRGSLPTSRAEATYITSGVTGNYEKSMQNGPGV